MCGIAGLVSWDSVGSFPFPGGPTPQSSDSPPRHPAWWPAVSQALAHRGPDGQGFWAVERPVPGGSVTAQLAHRRLAILDLDGGHQPLISEHTRGTSATVFNGCIYNHAALRRELLAAGHRFASHHSDTEVIPHAVARWGESAWSRLDGMFAIAHLEADGTLTLVRDRVGEKPLYYCEWLLDPKRRRVAFASTIPALLAILRDARPGWATTIDPLAMREWIAFGYSHRTPWHDVAVLPPGTCRRWGPGATNSPTSHPACGPLVRTDAEPPRDASHTAERLLLRSVSERLDADVPLGIFLSGGIDSPLIAWAASQTRPDIEAFTVCMPDAAFDESHRAAAVAKHLGLRHHILECRPSPAHDLTRLIAQLGLPFGDSSLLPSAWVAAAARKHVKVALGGDGADELFDGYQRYRGAAMLRHAADFFALLPGESGPARSGRAKLGRLADAARNAGYLDLPAIFPTGLLAGLTRQTPHRSPAAGVAAANQDPSLHDLRHYLPDDILRKSDTASMSAGLELRSPFLSREIIEDRLARTPRDRGAKQDLRRLAERHLPIAIARAPKSGFAIPLARWIREDFGGLGTLVGDAVRTLGAWGSLGVPIDPAVASALLDDHLAGRRDHAQRLYHLAVLAMFASGA